MFDEKQSGPTLTVMADFTHLVRKHIAGDLVGDNMRVVGEDTVQYGAVILSCKKSRRMKTKMTHRITPESAVTG